MDAILLDAIDGTPSRLALLFGALLILWSMSWNYRRMIGRPYDPDLLDGEERLESLDVFGPFESTKTVLTNRRVLQLRFRWLWSSRKQFAVALADVHSVTFRRHTRWLILIAGLVFVGTLNAVAVLLLLWGIEARTHKLLFDTPFSAMPYTRVRVRTTLLRHMDGVVRLHRAAQLTWARVRGEQTLASPRIADSFETFRETDFQLGRWVWGGVLLALALAVAQRVVEGRVSLDSNVFGPAYLATVLFVGRRGSRHGLWGGLLCGVMLLAVKFSGTGVIGWATSEPVPPLWLQYGLTLVTLMVLGGLAKPLSDKVGPVAGYLVLLVWPIAVAIDRPPAVTDLALLGRLAAAMALSTLGEWALETSGAHRPI